MQVTPRSQLVAVFVGAVALLTFNLPSIKHPLFDEMFYTKAAVSLYHSSPDTNPEHPPLSKVIIGAGIAVFGNVPMGWRCMSALAGAVTLSVIFLWVSKIANPFAAWIAVVLTVANGFWFVMSRVGMISIFELTFVVIGFYLLTMQRYNFAAIALGFAVACRWNAAFAVALAIVYLLTCKQAKPAVTIAWLSVTSYVACWLLVFGADPLRFIKAQLFILHYHRTTGGNLSIVCPWYKWIFRNSPEMALAYLMANPIVVFVGLVSCLLLCYNRKAGLICAAAIVFWLQWPVVGRKFQYYYYFLDSVTFLSIAAALWISKYRILAVLVTSLSCTWFIAHYASFTDLGPPWDTAFNIIKF